MPDTWHLMGVTLSAGGSLRWFRDALCDAEKAEARETGRDAYDIITELAAAAARSVPTDCCSCRT